MRDELFDCSQCGKVFKVFKFCDKNNNKTSERTPFSCTQCDKTFECEDVELPINNNGPFCCPNCNKKFGCSKCGNTFDVQAVIDDTVEYWTTQVNIKVDLLA